ncbi:MAG: hypothetical protein HUK02_05175 [Bacteroidaceae bacterium]|nr:hypothetical protein [Bacteroidaceae bacterium]
MRFAVCLFFTLCAATAPAQMWDSLCREDYQADTAQTRVLAAQVDALAFFRDNEYNTDFVKGYTLPGLWVRPTLTYQPLEAIRIEAGAHAAIFEGANRYPCFAYHDIATWKGQQFQHGIHVLPFFRVRASLSHLTFILGNLYGAQTHGLSLPMFNPEQCISADPEMGFQMLLDRPCVHLDWWVNWQSYIFQLDSHQEAFTGGLITQLRLSRPEAAVQWALPAEILLQHRGGQQDTTQLGVQTLANMSAGVSMQTRFRRPHLTAVRAEVAGLFSYQQKGTLWPFTTGFSLHAQAAVTLWDSFCLTAGCWSAPKQYANLFGSPLFSTLGTSGHESVRNGIQTPYIQASYTYIFSQHYQLGAQASFYTPIRGGKVDNCLDAGIYLRVSPRFRIRCWQ